MKKREKGSKEKRRKKSGDVRKKKAERSGREKGK